MGDTPGFQCKHFWSQPDSAGNVHCAWCGATEKGALQYVSDSTTPQHWPNKELP